MSMATMSYIIPNFRKSYNTIMASNNSQSALEDVDIAQPMLASDDDSEAALDAEQLRTHISSSKAARRWRYVKVAIGMLTIFVLAGIFVRLSRWKRPFDCTLKLRPALLQLETSSIKSKLAIRSNHLL
jgi:hypothetical protein